MIDTSKLVIMCGPNVIQSESHVLLMAEELKKIFSRHPEFQFVFKTMGKIALVCGVDAIFMEVHDNPEKSLCDAATQFPLDKFEKLLIEFKKYN